AGAGLPRVYTAGQHVPREAHVIEGGVVAAQAEAEAVFAARRAVTRARVAARLAQGSDHVVAEAGRWRGPRGRRAEPEQNGTGEKPTSAQGKRRAASGSTRTDRAAHADFLPPAGRKMS